MRHGFEWWEAFWKWLKIECAGYDTWDRRDEKLYALALWLAIKEDEFDKLWKETPRPWENILVPPKRGIASGS